MKKSNQFEYEACPADIRMDLSNYKRDEKKKIVDHMRKTMIDYLKKHFERCKFTDTIAEIVWCVEGRYYKEEVVIAKYRRRGKI